MKLTPIALEKINTLPIRMKIALALGKSESSVRRYIIDNDDSLTKAAALEVIKTETGLTDEEILESLTETTTA